MPPAVEPSVMDMVLSELRAIRDSIHELRNSMHTEIGTLASRINKVELAQSAQEGAAVERQRAQEEALRTRTWIGGLIVGGLGILEAWFHRGHP